MVRSKYIIITLCLFVIAIGCNTNNKSVCNNCIAVNPIPISSDGEKTYYEFEDLDTINLKLIAGISNIEISTGDVTHITQDTSNYIVKTSNWKTSNFMKEGCIILKNEVIKIKDTKFGYWIIDDAHKKIIKYDEFLGKEIKIEKGQELIIIEIHYESNEKATRIKDFLLIKG